MSDQTLRSWLDGLRRRWRALTRLRVSARAAAVVAVIAGAAWAADRVLAPTGLALVGLFLAAIAAAVGAVILLRAPLRRPPSDRQLARLAEERNGDLDDVVVTATERLAAEQPGPLDGLLVRAAEARLQEVEPERVIARETMRKALRWAGAAAVVLAIALAYAWAPAWRAVQTARLYVAPPKMAITVTPGHARIARGTPLKITARLEGLPAGATPDVPALVVASADAVPQPLRRDGDGYAFDWPKVDADFRYRVVAGALTSPEYQISAIDAAKVTRIDLEYEYPAFTKLAPRREEDAGDIFGPAGTNVRIRVHTDKPVRKGELALEGAAPLALAPEGGDATTLVAGLTIAQDGAYRIGLQDVDGLVSPEGTQYFVRVLDDRPPDVRIMRPAGDRQVTKLEEVVVEARADDDHGVQSLELVYAVKGRGEKVVPFRRGSRLPETSVNGTHTLFIEELDVEPGDFVTYYARARDVSRGKLSTEARSDIFFLEVRPFSETFFAAQSQAGMGGAGAGAAADLLESQKEIIVATWKLQRRAIAGQSATDVRAIAKAQGELRARAEALAAQSARPPRRRRGEPPTPAPTPASPLARAAGSMAKAETSLTALKPNDAVPHEMAAYNELLKLAAEETERQVTRQRGGGGGGGGRTGNQDLSALFDEELMRQQQTNYENRNAAGGGAQGAEKKDDALERVKALARRQDEIAEKQRELARARAAMPPEELKRQLERLTKEQEQLRREAEQLAQQMGQQQAGQQSGQQQGGQQQGGPQQGGQQAGGSQSGQSGGAQGGQRAQAGGSQAEREGSRELRQAAGEMANAARDLSQQNLDAAREQSSRTLERLRQLERRLGGESVSDDRRRRFGELEVEARLLAEAQRRLAEAARRQAGARGGSGQTSSSTAPSGSSGSRGGAAGSAGGNADAERKLALEQERLAARAEALEKQLAVVNRADSGEQAANAAIGARAELARGKPTQDMRQAAEALRRGAGGAEGATRDAADRAARAADTLGRAADRMAGDGGGGGQEAARLSDQLAGLRQARQRAEAAEAALREAVNKAMAAAEARKNAGARTGDAQAQAQERAEINRLQGEFDRALNDARRLAQTQGSEGGRDGGRQAGDRSNGEGSESGGQGSRQAQNGGGSRGGDGARDGRQDGGYGAYGTPEGHEFSRSAPGTEAFKQDYARWESLSKNVKDALEDLEASLADRLSDQRARDRVTAGEDDRAPAAYEEAVSRYYRSIAKRPSSE